MHPRSLLPELLRRRVRALLSAVFLLCASACFAQGPSIGGRASIGGTGSIGSVQVPVAPVHPPDTSLAEEIGGNGSACATLGTLGECYALWNTSALPNLTTNPANTNAQTQILTPSGNISPVTVVDSYLYPNFNGQVIFTSQPWFSPETGSYTCELYTGGTYSSSKHPCNGYNNNLAAVVKAQHDLMIREGQGGVNSVVDTPDYYGNSASQAFLEATVAQEAADAKGRCTGTTAASCPIWFSVMFDKGLTTSGMAAVSGVNAKALGCSAPSSGTDPAWSATTAYAVGAAVTQSSVVYIATAASTNQQPPNGAYWETNTQCVVNSFEAALDHVDGLWGHSPAYALSPANASHREILTFIVESAFLTVNWTTVYSQVASYISTQVSAGKYVAPYDFFHWSGGFTEANQAGAYMWVKPYPSGTDYSNSNPSTQYVLDLNNNYQANFYTSAQESAQTGIAGLGLGYDGSINTYNNGMMARECGRTIRFYSSKILTALPNHYSASFQLPAVIIPTWNDHGEGTNVENGFDNCFRMSTPTYNSGTHVLTWQMTPTTDGSSATYGATIQTVDHFKILFGNVPTSPYPLYTSQDNLTPTEASCTGTTTVTCSFDLSTATQPPFPGSTWNVYVKEIPQAFGLTQTNGGGNGNSAPLSQAF
jgi:hypothetical protein